MRPDFGETRDRPMRVLDFDIENRPLTYWWGDATTAEVTVIAWSWVGDETVDFGALEPPPNDYLSAVNMLARFMSAYEKADMVTGHYIRRHDLPTLNSMAIDLGMKGLSAKLTSDTKIDLVHHANLSVSQKSLADMLDIPYPKVEMPQAKWRDANRLTDDGIRKAVARARGDVIQHKEMRAEMIRRELLRPPEVWTP